MILLRCAHADRGAAMGHVVRMAHAFPENEKARVSGPGQRQTENAAA